MRITFTALVAALVLVATGNAYAQQNDPIRFGQFLETMPRPQRTIREMMIRSESNDAIEKAFGTAYQMINNTISSLYGPVYERFLKAAGNPGSIVMTAAEQTMMKAFRQGAKGLSDAVQFDFFRMQMVTRSQVGNGKPMWTAAMPSPKSLPAINIYQQLKALEASFEWETFKAEAENHLPKFEGVDKSIEALNKKFTTDQQNLPKKKIAIAEGLSQEMEDPEKAAALWEQHGVQKQKVFEQRYALVYLWWSQQCQILSALGAKLDALAVQAENGGEEFKTLKPLLADLQVRTWEALEKIVAVGQQLYTENLIALASQQQVREAIEMYKQFKVKD
jgi:hypothetical protein